MNEESKNKISFEANVEQVHVGDLINKGTPITNNNVVNLQFGQKETTIEYVTNHQKAVMMGLVNQIAKATQSDTLKISRVVLARAGAKRIKCIRQEKYVDIELYLTSWLKRVTPPASPPDERQADNDRDSQRERRHHELTTRLQTAQIELASVRANLRASLAVLAITIACGGALGYKAWTGQHEVEWLRIAFRGCSYAGKAYARGSIIANPPTPGIECVTEADGTAGQWKKIGANGKPSSTEETQ